MRLRKTVIEAVNSFSFPFLRRKEIRAKFGHRGEWYCIDIEIRLFIPVRIGNPGET